MGGDATEPEVMLMKPLVGEHRVVARQPTSTGNCEVAYTITDEKSYFISFMEALRVKLAEHPDREDIMDLHRDPNLKSTRSHPMLAKQRADGEQPARWIEVELQVVKDSEETWSTTLVMRDDNVDVMGFRTKRGDWYELGYQRMLPQEYRSKLLGWGNSYKSILAARNAAEVIDILTSANLGKTFATRAVRVLSRFPAVADDDNPRLAVVGLMFVVSESARLNPVYNAIERGWNTGTGFTEQLMTDHVWKYAEMSRRLMHWKRGNYSEPQPTSELRDIYLVLNEEYMVGDLLSFAYPEMLKVSFPEMFMVPYTVEVNLRRVNNNVISSVCGKIVAFIVDEHRHSVPFRVGSMLFTEESCQFPCLSEASLDLVRSAVPVPPGWVLRIEVDLCIQIPHSNKAKHLKATLIFDKENLSQSQTPKDTGIEIKGTISRVEDMQDFPAQLSRPVEVKMVSGHPTVVYTIGDDVMSFTEFIMALRRILSDHPDREDIMEGHHLLNLSSTREHPLLRKTRPEPGRWVRVKLQVVNGQGEETSSTTLVMKDDDLYVHGFFNRNNEVLFKLRGNHKDSKSLIPEDYHHHSTKDLKWGTSYASILNLDHIKDLEEQKEEIVRKLMTKNLDRRSAECAVCELSSYTDVADADDSRARLSLAALIVIVCESARMNPLHNSFAVGGWMHGIGESTRQLMFDFVWEYGKLSSKLREWKQRNYGEPQCGSEAQAIYLVRNAVLKGRKRGGSAASQPSNPPSSGGDSMKQSREDSGPSSRPGNNNSPPGGGEDDDRMVTRRSQDNDPGESERPSQPVEADDAQGHGRPRVELLALAMHANLLVDGMEIVVFDGKRGQIVYRRDEQGHRQEDIGQQEDKCQRGQGMVDLVLTGPYRGISAEYGCFAIKIDIPRTTSTRSGSEEHPPSKWEWNCDDPNHAAQVDTMRPAHGIICSPDGHKVAEVTYAVMSDAREATVQVRLRLKGGSIPSCVSSGKITALIDGFDVPSVLLNCYSEASGCRCLLTTSTAGDSWLLLELARNVVAVPCGRVLHIVVHLHIQTDDGKEVKVNVPLSFDNGICSTKTDDGNEVEVEVEVTWYPEITRPVDVVHTIGDEASFTKFIMDLRRILAEHPDREDIFELRPLLAKQHAEQPTRWLHVKLQVEGEEMSSTTLLMRDDNLYVCGFMNRIGILFKLVDNQDSESFLPEGFHLTTDLKLGVSYNSLLQAKNRDDVVRKLTAVQLGSGFAKDAVRVLSSHPNKVAGISMSIEVALAGLIFIVCESARMISVHKSIEKEWRNGKVFTEELMENVWKYGEMSRNLQAWKSRNYTQPHRVSELQATHLVLNTSLGDDYTKGDSRPRVELLAISADLGVIGTKIIVLDGKRGQIIYRHEKQGEQGGTVDLVLTGPYTVISGYGCFAIKIDIPATSPIKWEWDCYDPNYAAQVDVPPVTHPIYSPHDNREVAKVTYAVMSHAREATVQVKLRLNNGHSPDDVSGKIRAFVGGWKVPIVLFSRAHQGTGQCFSSTHKDSWFLLQLARNVVAMPYGKMLRIEIDVDLQIETSKKHLNADVYIEDGIRRQRLVVDGFEVEVNVSWYPEVNMAPEGHPELVYTIGDDEMSYIRFIMAVRRIIADHQHCGDILGAHPDSNLRSTRQHPLLSNHYGDRRWLYVKLQVAGEETSTILIAIMSDDLAVHGFFNNQNEDYWYSTTGWSALAGSIRREKLSWGSSYDRILQVSTTDWEKVVDKLNSERLGKTSAVNAVRVLSRFSKRNLVSANSEAEARLALVRLMVMICDSARMNPVLDAIAGGWINGTQFTKQLMDYIRYWDRISTALQDWRDSSYRTWEKDDYLEGIGIKSPEDALDVVHLCSAERMNRSLSRTDLPSTSSGDKIK